MRVKGFLLKKQVLRNSAKQSEYNIKSSSEDTVYVRGNANQMIIQPQVNGCDYLNGMATFDLVARVLYVNTGIITQLLQ